MGEEGAGAAGGGVRCRTNREKVKPWRAALKGLPAIEGPESAA